ncbi:BnaC07g15440D [Brassica napus]|uniref:BnaC07g15440D protein n=1 Tax=Brassica napus TaxID=3708 RepID=A0A078H3A4_BRANA|nr:BnaC07g15440D [Brassica napus]
MRSCQWKSTRKNVMNKMNEYFWNRKKWNDE